MEAPATSFDPRVTVVPDDGNASPYPDIPGYTILRRLGRGGMATVYLAVQESLGRQVAMKVIDREGVRDEVGMQRFENEARTIAKFNHPAIVTIYEVGHTRGGRLYFTMPYLPNGHLGHRDLRVDDAHVVALLRTVLTALDYAHAHDTVHRDVKPENIMFDEDDRAQLTDFGIALSKTDVVRVTTAGLAVGSSGYMAPEQARGDAVDARADLYSVGVMAYEMLAGELPYRSSDALAMALMHANSPVPRLPHSRWHWQNFIDKAMAKASDQRYASAQQMIAGLDRLDRRTGNHLSSRALRTFDRTVAGIGWKRPRLLAIVGLLLISASLYAERGRLPLIGSPQLSHGLDAGAAPLHAIPAKVDRPATVSTGFPKPDASPIQANALSSAATDAGSSASSTPLDAARKKARHSKTANRNAQKPGALRRLWDRIRHPSAAG